jgi:hypothetical protein
MKDLGCVKPTAKQGNLRWAKLLESTIESDSARSREDVESSSFAKPEVITASSDWARACEEKGASSRTLSIAKRGELKHTMPDIGIIIPRRAENLNGVAKLR